jgi:hypothetical protein
MLCHQCHKAGDQLGQRCAVGYDLARDRHQLTAALAALDATAQAEAATLW